VNPDFRKVALIAASLGLIVSLFFALRPDDEEQAAPTTAQKTAPATTNETDTTATQETEPATTETETEPATTAPPPDETVTIRITVPAEAAPKVRKFSVRRGRRVELVIRSELSDHVHLHGYDLLADVAPGTPGRITFTADAPGRFDIELEERGLEIGELEVRP
jgi:hypothetical protein